MNLDSYFVYGFRSFLISAVFITIVCTIIWHSIELKVKRFNESFPEHAVSVTFVSSAVRTLDVLLGVLAAMSQVIALKGAIETILSASGVIALCITIAARESLSNYIAGFLLTIHKPFKIGDYVYLEKYDTKGTVTLITFRHTVIKTDEENIVTVPNSNMNSIVVEIIEDPFSSNDPSSQKKGNDLPEEKAD